MIPQGPGTTPKKVKIVLGRAGALWYERGKSEHLTIKNVKSSAI
jgi:hypothetical protein